MTDTPLSTVKEREKVKIKSIEGGKGLKRRLSDLGLYEGATVEVVRNEGSGPIVVKIFDSKIMLGKGQAQKITVSLLK